MDDSLAVVVAAGLGSRLLPLTDELPKCKLDVQRKPMLHRALSTFTDLGISKSVVIGGYKADKLILPDESTLVLNHEYASNNILHSLACARAEMACVETALISYSDIVFRNNVVERLLAAGSKDISIVVDQSWAERYNGRLMHPLTEAEAAQFDEQGRLVKIGKGLLNENQDARHWGEFIGMLRFTARGQELFWTVFDSVQDNLSPESPFQMATHWRQAYVTDLLQEMVDRGMDVHCTLIQGGWLEIDTSEDYETASAFDFSQGGN